MQIATRTRMRGRLLHQSMGKARVGKMLIRVVSLATKEIRRMHVRNMGKLTLHGGMQEQGSAEEAST